MNGSVTLTEYADFRVGTCQAKKMKKALSTR